MLLNTQQVHAQWKSAVNIMVAMATRMRLAYICETWGRERERQVRLDASFPAKVRQECVCVGCEANKMLSREW
jgi:hypothetical protein